MGDVSFAYVVSFFPNRLPRPRTHVNDKLRTMGIRFLTDQGERVPVGGGLLA